MSKESKIKFDWDSGNIEKSSIKHGISNEEAESIFNDPHLLTFLNLKHSADETRYICYGESKELRQLTTYFTFRKGKIRIIGSRISNKKERALYENYKS